MNKTYLLFCANVMKKQAEEFLKTLGIKTLSGSLKIVSNRKKNLLQNEIRMKDYKKIFQKSFSKKQTKENIKANLKVMENSTNSW